MVTRNLDTTSLAGVVPTPQGIPAFCTENPPPPFPPCTPVPGAPLDLVTGQANAVGSDALVAPDISFTAFSRAGDL